MAKDSAEWRAPTARSAVLLVTGFRLTLLASKRKETFEIKLEVDKVCAKATI